MTLSELKNRCDMAGIAYSYGSFEQSIQPPHLVGHVIDSDNFSADDMVYYTNLIPLIFLILRRNKNVKK